MQEEMKKLEVRVEELENRLKGVGGQQADVDPEKMKVFREVSEQLGFDPDTVCGINECQVGTVCITCRTCRVCTVCSTCKVCQVCTTCRVCEVCQVCKVCTVCINECTCGPCIVSGPAMGGGRFGGLG